jgi:heme exporter protein B
VSALAAVLWKDLVTEWRRRERVVAMLVFSLLVVVVFHFALPEGATRASQAFAPGLLWVAYVFASVLGFDRAFALELENDALAGLALAPVDRGFVYLGKTLACFVLLALVQAAAAVVFSMVFELPLAGRALPFAAMVALGSLGLNAVGTLVGALSARTRHREVLLPLLLFPLLVPLLLACVGATRSIFAGEAVPFATLQLLIVCDAVYLIVSFLCFEYVLDE